MKHIDFYFFFSQDAKQTLGRYPAIEVVFMLCGIMLLCHNAVSEYKFTHRNGLVLEISDSLHKLLTPSSSNQWNYLALHLEPGRMGAKCCSGVVILMLYRHGPL